MYVQHNVGKSIQETGERFYHRPVSPSETAVSIEFIDMSQSVIMSSDLALIEEKGHKFLAATLLSYHLPVTEPAVAALRQNQPEDFVFIDQGHRMAAEVQITLSTGSAALRYLISSSSSAEGHPSEVFHLYLLDTDSFKARYPDLNLSFKEFIQQYIDECRHEFEERKRAQQDNLDANTD